MSHEINKMKHIKACEKVVQARSATTCIRVSTIVVINSLCYLYGHNTAIEGIQSRHTIQEINKSYKCSYGNLLQWGFSLIHRKMIINKHGSKN